MIRTIARRAAKFLRSPLLATLLLAFGGVWSIAGTLIPQGEATSAAVVAWAAQYPAPEAVVRAIGLHQAFTSPLFLACALALGLCTALCAWQRTRAALARARTLRKFRSADAGSVIDGHDFEIACCPDLSAQDALSVASETLGVLGVRHTRRGDLLVSVSSPWSVWGSPVFHWGLLGLMAALIVGNLFRADGLMGVAVGQTKADVEQSYGTGNVHTGPLYDWVRVGRSIRVDSFEVQYRAEGIDRGPTPAVSLLDGAGNVLATQRVYPNMTLKNGSITIYPAGYGLSTTLVLLNSKGVETGRSVQLVDFSDTEPGGTVPHGSLVVHDSSGAALLSITASVPLGRRGGSFVQAVPAQPTARVVASSPDGTIVVDRLIGVGEAVALPTGDSLRLEDVGYYARLSVVDDLTIPLLYAAMAITLVGLTGAVAVRQQAVLVTAVEGPDGVKVAATVRLWRNAASSRGEIESELTDALGGVEKGSTT